MNRRRFLELAAAASLSGSVPGYAQATRTQLAPWQPGMLDIHHLAYGRGNATFLLCPDGTTLLIDAGTNEDSLELSCAQPSKRELRPGEWIAQYILRQMKPAGRQDLDLALVTHIHPDHMGDVGPENPLAPGGRYRLTGIADVDARVPIGTLIDRGFPDYSYPIKPQAPYALNYLEYVRSRQALGQTTERLRPGSGSQIRLARRPRLYPGFAVRNLAANGEVWTGVEERTHRYFPELHDLQLSEYPSENMCSIAILLSYGKFSYYTGGDLTSDTEETGAAWRDIETPVAHAAGPVSVAVANHHGYFDAVGASFVRALRPQAFIVPAWYVAHPSIQPLRRMLSQRLYSGDRDLFATCTMEANRLVNNQFLAKVKSLDGNVVVRVDPGGEQFHIAVTDNGDDTDRVKSTTGPYRCA